MSTTLYAARMNALEDHKRPADGSTPSSGRTHYVEIVSALVPAEVLSLHAVIMSYVANTRLNAPPEAAGAATHSLSASNWIDALPLGDVLVLKWAFIGLILLSIGLYALPRALKRHWNHRYDWARMAIAPLAFLAWTMLQPFTAFDALQLPIEHLGRTVAALFLAITLAGVANALSPER